MNDSFQAHYFGKTDYIKSLQIQSDWVEKIKKNPSQVMVLGFEYDPVITLGRRAKRETDVLKDLGTPVIEVPRGGQATFHSPGQLVIYPICNIRFFEYKVKSWVELLLINTQKTFENLSPKQTCPQKEKGTGLFCGDEKVASLGLRIDRGVSSFGLALNLKNDLNLFGQIRPCGNLQQKMGSLNYQGELSLAFSAWCKEFEPFVSVDKKASITQFEGSFAGI